MPRQQRKTSTKKRKPHVHKVPKKKVLQSKKVTKKRTVQAEAQKGINKVKALKYLPVASKILIIYSLISFIANNIAARKFAQAVEQARKSGGPLNATPPKRLLAIAGLGFLTGAAAVAAGALLVRIATEYQQMRRRVREEEKRRHAEEVAFNILAEADFHEVE